METKIIVTPGETNFIDQLIKHDIPFSTENLLVGDIHIKKGDKVIYIIERKAKGDLDASIKDGRYKEQKTRLIETGVPRHCIIYLIESLKDKFDESGKKRIWNAMTNTFNRDGFSVFQTKTLEQSVIFVKSLCNSVEKFDPYIPTSTLILDTTPVNVNIKKKQINKSDWFMYSLTLIPRCSINVATVITAKYPTILSLKTEIDKSGTECLANLTVGSANRRIGKKLSIDICEIINNEIK